MPSLTLIHTPRVHLKIHLSHQPPPCSPLSSLLLLHGIPSAWFHFQTSDFSTSLTPQHHCSAYYFYTLGFKALPIWVVTLSCHFPKGCPPLTDHLSFVFCPYFHYAFFYPNPSRLSSKYDPHEEVPQMAFSFTRVLTWLSNMSIISSLSTGQASFSHCT